MLNEFAGFEHRMISVGDATLSVWMAGSGEPLLLIHGYPQTHMMWRKVAPKLAETFTVVCPDTRGYGDSSCPEDDGSHKAYSKREMGNDFVKLMAGLGFASFYLMGHDRGARVCHQMVLDHPECIRKVIFLDIISTLDMYERTDIEFAKIYYHWFFLIQKEPLPEKLIEGAPEAIVRSMIQNLSIDDDAFPDEVIEHYVEKFSRPEVIHATCEDYRAAATVDLENLKEAKEKFDPPALILWGAPWLRKQNMIEIWKRWGKHVSGTAVNDSGHFIPEQNPGAVVRAAEIFFSCPDAELDAEQIAAINA